MDILKVCTGCKQAKPLEAFARNAARGDGRNNYCRPCWTLYTRQWWSVNPEKHKAYCATTTGKPGFKASRRNAYFLRKYGIDSAMYDNMVVMQCGSCLVCGEVPEKALIVHHNHRTGWIVGLACYACNTGMGQLRNDPRLLRRAATLNEDVTQ